MIIVGYIEFDVTMEIQKMNTDHPGKVSTCVWVCDFWQRKPLVKYPGMERNWKEAIVTGF